MSNDILASMLLSNFTTFTQTSNLHFIITQMTVDFSRDVLLGMLRKGQTGAEILDILNVIVPDQSEVQSESATEEVAV